jgi:hypothetical protein
MNNKRIYLILSISVGIFVILIGLLFVFNSLKNKTSKVVTNAEKSTAASSNPAGSVTQSIGQSSSTKLIIDDDLMKSAQAKKSLGECLKISNQVYANNCIEMLAQSQQSESICSNIRDRAEGAKCTDGVIFEKATKNGNITLCQNIQDASVDRSCIVHIVQGKDLNINNCQSLPDKEKGYCVDYLNYSLDIVNMNSAQSLSDCQKISDYTSKIICQSKFAK